MKICTITCHKVYNHGASLQAYALSRYLENRGHEVEIIDYRPDYLSNHYKLLGIDNQKWEKSIFLKIIYVLLKLPSRLISLKRKRAFDNFSKRYLKVTKEVYVSNDQLRNEVPVADAYICGSDQIWNCLRENGKDPAFYLDFVPNNKIKISYAASFATESISEEYKPIVKERVKKLDGISVREKSGVALLKKLNIPNVSNVVDPVFLLSKGEWDKIATKRFKEKYILIYDFDDSDLIKKIATNIATMKSLKIYSINPGKFNYTDMNFKFVGPEIFLSLLRDAQFVISNSFHAAVFSIIFEKDFVIVNREESINTRMRDLLDDLDLNDRLIDSAQNQLYKNINYMKVKTVLKSKIEYSKGYLNKFIKIG